MKKRLAILGHVIVLCSMVQCSLVAGSDSSSDSGFEGETDFLSQIQAAEGSDAAVPTGQQDRGTLSPAAPKRSVAQVVSAAQTGAEFAYDHKDQIIAGAQQASKVADALVGNGDGVLSMDEALSALQKLGNNIGKLKNFFTGIFSKKTDNNSKKNEQGQPSIRRAAVHMPRPIQEIRLTINQIKQTLGDKLESVKELLGEIRSSFTMLHTSSEEQVIQFIKEQEGLDGLVCSLLDALNQETPTKRAGFFDVEKMMAEMKNTLDAIEKLKQDGIIQQEQEIIFYDASDNKQFSGASTVLDVSKFDDKGTEEVDRLSLLKDAGHIFEALIGYEDEDDQMTINDVPGIVETIKSKIDKLKKIISNYTPKRRSSEHKRTADGFDEVVLTQIKAHILEIGKAMTQLAKIFRVSEDEIKTIYKDMNIAQVSAFIESEKNKDYYATLTEQIGAYGNMLRTNRAPGSLNSAEIAKIISITLEIIEQVNTTKTIIEQINQATRPNNQRIQNNRTHDTAGEKPSWYSTSKEFAVKATCAGVVISALLTFGQNHGWWDVTNFIS